MSSSVGELVTAMRRNFAKVDKLSQKPAAVASLRFCFQQVEEMFKMIIKASELIDAVHFGLSKHAIRAFFCFTILFDAIFAKQTQSGWCECLCQHTLEKHSEIDRFRYSFRMDSSFSMDHSSFHWQVQFLQTPIFQVLTLSS